MLPQSALVEPSSKLLSNLGRFRSLRSLRPDLRQGEDVGGPERCHPRPAHRIATEPGTRGAVEGPREPLLCLSPCRGPSQKMHPGRSFAEVEDEEECSAPRVRNMPSEHVNGGSYTEP